MEVTEMKICEYMSNILNISTIVYALTTYRIVADIGPAVKYLPLGYIDGNHQITEINFKMKSDISFSTFLNADANNEKVNIILMPCCPPINEIDIIY